mmetsp:Transcript_9283/g.12171  ORF Transcript_9283/g.12171 Transcript_9283/m.12171 type:complete len:357 (+) Transcript_9283:80-1150(+)
MFSSYRKALYFSLFSKKQLSLIPGSTLLQHHARNFGVAKRPPRRFNAGSGFKGNDYGAKKRILKTATWIPVTIAMGVAGAGAFYYANLTPVPYTDRKRFLCTTPAMEDALGESTWNQLKEQQKERILPPSHTAVKTVRRVLLRLISAMQLDRKEKGLPPLEYDWVFHVVQDPTVNACALPGGKVIVNTGLFKVTPTEDALAMVLAHEMAHVLARHGGEKMSKGLFLQLVFQVLEMFGIQGIGIFQIFAKFLLELPNSRECEREADTIGFELLIKACYDPREGPKTFKRMHKAIAEMTGKDDDTLNDYLSTHPSDETRISALEEKMPEAIKRYKEGRCQEKEKAWFMSKQIKHFNEY